METLIKAVFLPIFYDIPTATNKFVMNTFVCYASKTILVLISFLLGTLLKVRAWLFKTNDVVN